MTETAFLLDGRNSDPLLVLAHGAGAPMDTPFMTFFAEGLTARGWRVARFEFPYMARRRHEPGRRPPPTNIHPAGHQTIHRVIPTDNTIEH